MALDRDDEYAFRKREVEALEAIGRAASIFVKEYEEREERRKQFDDGIRDAGGAPEGAKAPQTSSSSSTPASAESDPAAGE